MESADRASQRARSLQLHVACFVIWDEERQVLKTALIR